MASHQNQGSLIPRIQLSSSSTVDFVENRLPAYHAAFDHPHSRFDASRQRFVDDSFTLQHSDESPRPTAPQVETMAFWSDILPNAMNQLSTNAESENCKKSGHSIRSLGSWQDIAKQLELAKAEYEFCDHEAKDKPGFGRNLRKSTRKLLDGSIVPAQQVVNFVPEIEMASPITTTVKMLFAVIHPVLQTLYQY